MSNVNLRSRLQDTVAGAGTPSAKAATTNIVNFSDWMFYGAGSSVFVSVTISPASGSDALTYGVVVLQTPHGVIISQGSFSTSNAGAGFTVNLSTSNDMYPVNELGTSVQAWAYAQIYVGGHPQGQYSETIDYTIET